MDVDFYMLVCMLKIGLEVNELTLKLSHHTTGQHEERSSSSDNKDSIQMSSDVTKAKARYPDYVLERATTVCFLEDQLIKFPPKKTQYPDVDLRSSRLPHNQRQCMQRERLVQGVK